MGWWRGWAAGSSAGPEEGSQSLEHNHAKWCREDRTDPSYVSILGVQSGESGVWYLEGVHGSMREPEEGVQALRKKEFLRWRWRGLWFYETGGLYNLGDPLYLFFFIDF